MRPPGMGEILFILLLCAVVFSISKVNWMGDVLGGFARNFRRGLKNDDRIAVRDASGKNTRQSEDVSDSQK